MDQCLDYIERKFTGQESLEVTPLSGENEEETDKIKLNYYKSIPSESKVYNKVLVP